MHEIIYYEFFLGEITVETRTKQIKGSMGSHMSDIPEKIKEAKRSQIKKMEWPDIDVEDMEKFGKTNIFIVQMRKL